VRRFCNTTVNPTINTAVWGEDMLGGKLIGAVATLSVDSDPLSGCCPAKNEGAIDFFDLRVFRVPERLRFHRVQVRAGGQVDLLASGRSAWFCLLCSLNGFCTARPDLDRTRPPDSL
jgi:hypothetical protein